MTKFSVYIENEGALFRGTSRGWPEEVWSERQKKWIPYTGDVPKGVEWGEVISPEEAAKWEGAA